jgi:four helix bundle protein
LLTLNSEREALGLSQKSYRDLEIYQLSYKLAMKLHGLSLTLPKHELYEEGGQIRRSSKGVTSCIVEGYGRRKYKNDFVRFLVYAQASCDETEVHLNFIHDSGYIDDQIYNSIKEENNRLGRKINRFIQYVEKEWK